MLIDVHFIGTKLDQTVLYLLVFVCLQIVNTKTSSLLSLFVPIPCRYHNHTTNNGPTDALIVGSGSNQHGIVLRRGLTVQAVCPIPDLRGDIDLPGSASSFGGRQPFQGPFRFRTLFRWMCVCRFCCLLFVYPSRWTSFLPACVRVFRMFEVWPSSGLSLMFVRVGFHVVSVLRMVLRLCMCMAIWECPCQSSRFVWLRLFIIASVLLLSGFFLRYSVACSSLSPSVFFSFLARIVHQICYTPDAIFALPVRRPSFHNNVERSLCACISD